MRLTTDPAMICLPERLDVASSADIRRLLHEAVDHCIGELRIDVSQVSVIDAAGLGVLVGTRRRADEVGVRVVLVGCQPRLQRLLAVTRLTRLFGYEDRIITLPEHRISV